MFIVIHMWKCRKVRTTLSKIHLQKYMVKEAANYWAKKAVSFKHLHAKKRKMVWWVFIMLVYRKKEKKNPFISGKQSLWSPRAPVFSPAFLWHINWPGCHSNTSSTAGVDDECFNKQEVTKSPQLRGDLHWNRQYQGNKNNSFVVLTTIVIMIRSIIIHNKWSYFNGH